MCCEFGEGSFTVLDPQGDVIYTGGDFTDSDLEQFCTQEMSVGEHMGAQVEVMPNPASGRIVVSGVPIGSTVTAVDLLGRPVSRSIRLNEDGSLDVSDWPRGWVLLRVETGAGVHVKRVLLR
jgi:hypothetical protein